MEMAPINSTPPRSSARRRPGRPRVRPLPTAASEPPRKRLRYQTGGLGVGGGFPDNKEASDELTGLTPSTSRARPSRRHSDHKFATTQSPPVTLPRIRRDRSQPHPRYSSAAAAASAMTTQSEGYKPREERSWEEFHQDLDIDAELMVFGAEEIDAARGSNFGPGTPSQGVGFSGSGVMQNGTSPELGHALQLLTQQAGTASALGSPIAVMTPVKRRPGRPPKRPEHLLYGLGSPPTQRIAPAPTHNPRERLNLQKPVYRRVDTFSAYEQSKSVGINYVDNALRNVGYQESDVFVRPTKVEKPYITTYIRGGDGAIDEELDFALLNAEASGSIASSAHTLGGSVGRVEYDMDEQDERWLDSINSERKSDGVEGIRPAIFEITMTQIEKEWHALEKREFNFEVNGPD
jgi:NuA3 HAT complex component NTO1